MQKYNFLSLGAGRQSTAMALMAAHGVIEPMPDAAIFADTGEEPRWVYETVAWLSSGNVLPFEVTTVGKGRLGEALLGGDDSARIPAFVGHGGMADRQCSRNWKIRPIRRAVRQALGVGPRGYIAPGTVSQWIGISTNEAHRMKPSDVQFMVNRWPLIELGLTVGDCERWLLEHDYPVPWSSACVFCPYLGRKERKRIKDHDPAGHERACQVDRGLRSPENVERFRGQLYVDSQRRPLDQVDLDMPPSGRQIEMFGNECEGICGV